MCSLTIQAGSFARILKYLQYNSYNPRWRPMLSESSFPGTHLDTSSHWGFVLVMVFLLVCQWYVKPLLKHKLGSINPSQTWEGLIVHVSSGQCGLLTNEILLYEFKYRPFFTPLTLGTHPRTKEHRNAAFCWLHLSSGIYCQRCAWIRARSALQETKHYCS